MRNTLWLRRAGQREEGPSNLFRPVDLWPMAERQQCELGGREEPVQMLGDATVQVRIARTPDEANRAGERGQLAGAPGVRLQGGIQVARRPIKAGTALGVAANWPRMMGSSILCARSCRAGGAPRRN